MSLRSRDAVVIHSIRYTSAPIRNAGSSVTSSSHRAARRPVVTIHKSTESVSRPRALMQILQRYYRLLSDSLRALQLRLEIRSHSKMFCADQLVNSTYVGQRAMKRQVAPQGQANYLRGDLTGNARVLTSYIYLHRWQSNGHAGQPAVEKYPQGSVCGRES